jgi:hypothetical protein
MMPGDGPALNVFPFNGPQEVDGLVIQMDPPAINAGQPPLAQDGGQNNNQFFHNLEMNFMFTQEWQPDLVFQMHLERKRSAQFYRIWANYFAPAGTPDVSVKIPKKWAPFFLSNLLQPEAFNWSKSFLSSEIPSMLLEPELESLSFAIPKGCPKDKFLEDVLSENSQSTCMEQEENNCDAPAPIIVESELRRSKRLKDSRAGFRQGACPKRNYLMCHHNFDGPPSLFSKVIQNLGTKFCNMSDEDLSDNNLKKKKFTSGSVGQKKMSRKDKENEKIEDTNEEDK